MRRSWPTGRVDHLPGWYAIGDQPLYEVDVELTGPLADWNAHLSLVLGDVVPLPSRWPPSWSRSPSG